jgi:hypothetical protein
MDDPKVMKLHTDVALPNLAKLLMDMLLPSEAHCKTDRASPNCTLLQTESVEPRRIKDRRLKAEPKLVKLTTLEQEDMRQKARIDKVDPKLTKSAIERDPPHEDLSPAIEIPLPNRKKLLKESEEPMFTKLRIEIDEPDCV